MARVSKYERTAANDIRYRGPLSYRHLLIFGWLCISMMILGKLTSLGIRLDPNQPQWMLVLDKVCNTVGEFSLPFFLLANFAIILDRKKTFKQQLTKFGGLSLLIVVLFIIAKEYYLVGFITAVIGNRAEANKIAQDMLHDAAMNGSLIFNLFIDLFMCTLFMFFLEYVPKKSFRGKMIRLFRAMAVLPVLYEMGALILRVSMVFGKVKPPYIVFPFLTTKPFFSFILFVILALHIKWENYRFRKRGKSSRQLERFLQTNDHSFRFSVFTSVMILVTGVLDFIAAVFGTGIVGYMDTGYDLSVNLTEEALERALTIVEAWKIGSHCNMIFLIPIVLLFSYTRNHRNEKLDTFIPIGGIALALFVGFQGLYMGITMNLPIIMNNLLTMAQQMMSM